MKKILYILSIIFLLITFINLKNNKTIQDDSIRFRIIANSNSIEDQNLKKLIKRELEINLFPLVENSKSIYETRNIIHQNEELINSLLSKYNIEYDINYGINFFPEKEYDDYKYKSGNYESLVIKLGEAKGNNWWCVMYPPLCLIDQNSNNKEEIEYKLYIKEILQK
jgi:stage II sporulation protein R